MSFIYRYLIVSLSSALLLALVLVLSGCGGEEAPGPAPAPSTPTAAPSLNTLNAGAPAPAPVEAPAAATAASEVSTPINQPGEKDEDGMDMGLKALNEALKEYRNNNESSPSSLEELVSKRFIRALPTPPPGRKYALDKQSGLAVLQ